jgi:Flp pilus assembly protein TadG
MVVIMLSMMVAVVLLPLVGLAIDGSVLYLIQAKMSAAVDAATLAAARSLSVGLDLSSQTASATATAQSFFSANFPTGYWNTTNLSLSTTVAQTAYKTRTVTMQASVTVPLTFMRLLGQTGSTVAAQGQTSRRDVVMIVVIDRSSSIANAGVCGTMIAAAQNFVGYFSNGRDEIGLVTFADGPNLTYAPTLNFDSNVPSLTTALGGVQCSGDTGTAAALTMAYAELKAVNEPGALNLIVFFTDGHPNGVAASFPVKTVADTRYGVNSSGYSNYNTPVYDPPSTCSSSANKAGVVSEWSGEPAPSLGYTGGLLATTTQSASTTGVTLAPSVDNKCAMYSSPSNLSIQINMREDIAYIPATDLNGNATTGYQSVVGLTYQSGPYAGQIRVDMPAAVVAASVNAADNQATAIRNDPNLIPVIYAIGLGGTSAEPIDATFMERMSNDPRSPIYNSAKPAGEYFYSPTATDLGGVFQQVASEILRISQ